MKTEKRKAYLLAQRYIGGIYKDKPEIIISFDDEKSTDLFAKSLVCEIEVSVPALNDAELDALLDGAELESLIKARDTMRAEFQSQRESIEDRISKLKCIESKGNGND